jgi:hypothetical protein
MPFSRSLPRFGPDLARITRSDLLKVFDRREAFEISQSSVTKVPVSVVNVTTRGYRAESGFPNSAVKFTTASRRIAFARPDTI